METDFIKSASYSDNCLEVKFSRQIYFTWITIGLLWVKINRSLHHRFPPPPTVIQFVTWDWFNQQCKQSHSHFVFYRRHIPKHKMASTILSTWWNVNLEISPHECRSSSLTRQKNMFDISFLTCQFIRWILGVKYKDSDH